jgi:hypothetical protein
MPYAIKGKTVIKKKSGKVVGHSKNPKKYMRVLQAVEHGWKPGRVRPKVSKSMKTKMGLK